MSQKKIGILLFLIAICVLTSCLMNKGQDVEKKWEYSLSSFAKVSSKTENKEDNDVKREFCKVEDVQEGYFILKNTVDELYYIDNTFLGEFKVGDAVLLLYLERNPMDEGIYFADVHAIYPDDNTLLYPAN